ncbi:hypothetical protein GV67_16155 [Pseudorhizobium pelagicum]|nr:hypothetical protein GV67_16155 [Pseudorhizobium pelagicum]
MAGDTATFAPTDKSQHAETISGLLAESAKPFRAKSNETLKVTFGTAGDQANTYNPPSACIWWH